ncbi:type II secretion system F family protein [Flagellimonas taeanensis]|uniref:type II secretion system F family protein n=1 Tax=Flavobacteriaceae TaxID=49546 RepID=UPI000E68613F|nr:MULTISPECIES: type II secretion system F family protein [Allomuricauda]MDC6384643.1 type II secretion system F family protein [Muricauda sp. SK9]RIV53610.1 type II secretion system F family protein [Allomuricauda taeanensis]
MGFKLEQSLDTKVSSTDTKQGVEKWLQKEIVLFGTFFNNKRKEDFYGELSILLKAGVQLREALDILRENQNKEKLRTFYAQMLEALDGGRSFSQILRSLKEFTEYEYYSVQIGEESGNLTAIFHELSIFFAQKNEQRRNLINALTYPMIILCTAILVVIFMLRMVVPMFEDIFRQNKVELPTITRWIIAVSNFIGDYGGVAIIVLIVLTLLRKPIFYRESLKRKKDYITLKLPYVGNFVRSIYLAQFTQAVALLTSSKVPLLNSIQMVKRMIRFYPLQDALDHMETRIMQGVSLHASMKEGKIFDNKMTALIKVAEETNQTEYIFEKLNQQYALEVQQKSKLLSALMEPLIIVLIGFFVGVILVSMYLPMFRLSSVLGG